MTFGGVAMTRHPAFVFGRFSMPNAVAEISTVPPLRSTRGSCRCRLNTDPTVPKWQ